MSPEVGAWWTSAQAGTIGGIGGALVGVLGGLLGTVVGVFGRQGRFRALAFGVQVPATVLGLATALVGLVALLLGQPFWVWFPLVQLGGVTAGVFGGLLPVTRATYRVAEQRSLEAAQFRRG